ncbi:MAG: hypothetical protein KC613_24410, partial [Myxococcales bacterium]|nr:hypothetical protein [Myxococcales bacterium]
MKRAVFTALIALTATACITEEAEPGAAPDAGAQADGSVSPDGGAQGCDTPNPAEQLGCQDNSDCEATQICQQVPGCVPS